MSLRIDNWILRLKKRPTQLLSSKELLEQIIAASERSSMGIGYLSEGKSKRVEVHIDVSLVGFSGRRRLLHRLKSIKRNQGDDSRKVWLELRADGSSVLHKIWSYEIVFEVKEAEFPLVKLKVGWGEFRQRDTSVQTWYSQQAIEELLEPTAKIS